MIFNASDKLKYGHVFGNNAVQGETHRQQELLAIMHTTPTACSLVPKCNINIDEIHTIMHYKRILSKKLYA